MKVIAGFTLLELLVSLVIMSIGLLCVIPTWRDIVARNHATASVNHFVTLLQFARNAAISRNTVMALCASADHKTCSGVWSDGQLIFVDTKQQGVVQTPSDIIYSYNKKQKKGHWRMQAFGNTHYLSILPLNSQTQMNASFIYCPNDNDAHFARAIFISKTGRIRVSEDGDKDGIDEDAEGKPLVCS